MACPAMPALPSGPHAANLSLPVICTMHLLATISNAVKHLELSIKSDD